MNAQHLAQSTAVFLGGGAFVVASLLSACAATPNGASPVDAASYGLSVAAELRLTRTQQEVAACLRERENSASYPLGLAPGYTTTEADGGVLRVTQWFFLKRGMTRSTRFVLRPAGDAATDVEVWLPMELTVAQGYRRAAIELIARCRENPGER